MLNTQVQYWLMREQTRHNLETEAQGRESIRVNWFNAQENARHNLVSEQIGWGNLNENIRHNKATEDLGWASLSETSRHNRASEGIGRMQATASLIQSKAATSQAKTARLDYHRRNIDSIHSRDLMDAQALAQHATAGKSAQEIYYGPQKNVREWIHSGTEVANVYAKMRGDTLNAAAKLIPAFVRGGK